LLPKRRFLDNDYNIVVNALRDNQIKNFPGISKAVREEASHQNFDVLMLDGTHARPPH
jgi:hypothetical protein